MRCHNVENRDAILNEGYQFFDGKLVIAQAWRSNMDLSTKHVKNVPIWIELHGLPLRYWGDKSLTKIVSRIGKFTMVDQATLSRARLQFARILVEVNVDQEFPDLVHFKDENGVVREQGVLYGWKPILCDKCNGYGHNGGDCVKRHKQDGPIKKVWVVKQKRMQSACYHNKGKL